jgi:4-carboxymuconolactone decarboxylase
VLPPETTDAAGYAFADPRIVPLPQAEWTDASREVFAFWGEPDAWENGSKTNIVMVLANHPALAMAYSQFGMHLLVHSTLSVRARELIVLRVAWHIKSEYEWHYHVGYAAQIGMGLDEIADIIIGPEAERWNACDRSVLMAVDELWSRSRISDATWAALSDVFDRQQLMDLVFTIGQYVMLSWAIEALGIKLEDGVDKIGFDLKTASGAPPIARLRPGEADDWSASGS